MAYLKITKNHNLEHYDVIYQCGCIRSAMHGTFNVIVCKEHHKYKHCILDLSCGCSDFASDSKWCDKHLEIKKEAKIRSDICDAKNNLFYLESKLRSFLADRNSD